MVTIPVAGPRALEIGEGRPGGAVVVVDGPALSGDVAAAVRATVHRMLALDLDLAGFYARCADDADLAWAARGAGRMMRGPSLFEDVVKTICTTNCAWSATVRMTTALVHHLGAPVPGAPAARAFPTPAAMADVPEAFYRETIRAGYRARALSALARAVASGELDLEALALATPEELPDVEVAARLLALPGIGPYATAHIMLLLGRFSRLILDSWTRPTYARVASGTQAPTSDEVNEGAARPPLVPDSEIVARFAPYGAFAGLAFWLVVTRDWHEAPETAPAPSPVTEPTT